MLRNLLFLLKISKGQELWNSLHAPKLNLELNRTTTQQTHTSLKETVPTTGPHAQSASQHMHSRFTIMAPNHSSKSQIIDPTSQAFASLLVRLRFTNVVMCTEVLFFVLYHTTCLLLFVIVVVPRTPIVRARVQTPACTYIW
jgi:hypothetical protein